MTSNLIRSSNAQAALDCLALGVLALALAGFVVLIVQLWQDGKVRD